MCSTIFNHVSIRKYKDKPICDANLIDILCAAVRASNTGNMQVYSIIVSKEEQIKRQLMPAHFNQASIGQAPVVLTFCADFNRFNKWCELRNAEPCYNNFLSFMTAATDAIIAAQNACIRAEELGLGICYFGTTIYNADKIIEILNLPKGVVPITTVTLGYPDEKPELTDRLPLDAVIHWETYKDYSEEDINKFYQSKENLADSKKFIEENGKETLAQVFTDVRYPKTNNEHFSKILLEVLKNQNFI